MPTITRANAAAFRRPLYRPDPVGPPQAYKTYTVAAPLDTHWRRISCEQAGCLAQHNGFSTTVDESTDLGARQAAYVRLRSGRPYGETRNKAGLTVFMFPAGTECFTQHQTRRSRPPLFVVRNGDHRANLGGLRRFDRPDQFVDDMQTGLDKLRTAKGRG